MDIGSTKQGEVGEEEQGLNFRSCVAVIFRRGASGYIQGKVSLIGFCIRWFAGCYSGGSIALLLLLFGLFLARRSVFCSPTGLWREK